MDLLTPDEARVLGVLIEKQMTTPDQYPLSLNAIVAGSNQKNNRSPVLEMSDDAAYSAVESLREKGLAVRVEQSGARVSKYKHVAAEKLDCRPAELALLAELMLRGPQTTGELRGRASRMQAFESLQDVEGFLRSLMEKPQPLARRLPPAPGTRAEKYAQLLTQDDGADDLDEEGDDEASLEELDPSDTGAAKQIKSETSVLTARVDALEKEVATMRSAIQRLAREIGASDPL